MVFLDESGFMLQPVVRRTWAPRGRTPVQRSWDRHERISGISALTVSPHRHHFGLYFHLQTHNLRWPHLLRFIHQVRRQLRNKIILILDRWNVHRSAVRRLLQRYPDQIHVEWLPSYAPELNPVEQVWNNTKYSDLANYIPEDIDDLAAAVRDSINSKRHDQQLLHSFFKTAKLEL